MEDTQQMSEPDKTRQVPSEPDQGRPVPDSAPEQIKPALNQPNLPRRAASPPAPERTATQASARGGNQQAAGASGPAVDASRPAGGDAARPAPRPTRGRVPTIHYELSYLVQNPERGPRGAVVLLHDLPGGAFVWQGVLPALVGSGRAVYAFDLLGYGESDHPWPADVSVWGHGDNLAPALRELGLTDIVLVGFGLGGGVAQVLANRLYREGLAALVLMNTYAYDYAYAPNWPMTEMEKRHDPDAPRHTTTDQMLADLRATLPTGAAKPRFLAGSALDAYVREWNGDLGREMLFQHLRQMRPDYILSVASDNKRLEIPTLIVWGEQDQVTPLTLGKRLARDIPGARLEVVPGAGHLILDDAPDRVGEVLAGFIGGLGRVERAS
jgi:pimeloyl-ACP methyl ester carboxylesterase